MVTNYDKIKNQNKLKLAGTLAEIWVAGIICDEKTPIPKGEQITEAVDYFYNWLGEEVNE